MARDSDKRASMREGPLAALFRSTTQQPEPDQPAPEHPAADHPVSAGPERPDSDQSQPSQRPEAEGSEPYGAPERPTAPPAQTRQATHQPEGSSEPPPPRSDLGPAEPPPPAAPSNLPEPKERLRQVFSDDLPQDMLEQPAFGRADPGASLAAATPRIHKPILRVVGVGGAGVNAVNRMIEAEVPGVEFMAVNTDLQSLQQSGADVTLHIGAELTRGLGSGSDPQLGYESAFESQDKIKSLLKGSDMVFVAAGAGGGTGTGAAPVVARVARDVGALTVGIVTKPFGFEGKRRETQAEAGIEQLAEEVDTLIVIPNNRLLSVLDRGTSMMEAFRVADDVLRQGVQGISDMVTLPGLINVDFADVRTIMSDAGQALLGIGMGVGDGRALDATEQAISSPLLETSVDGARSILLSITGGRDLSLIEVSDAAKLVQEAAHPEANIIFGAMVDENLDDQCWVTVVATRHDLQPRRAGMARGQAARLPAGAAPPARSPRRQDLNNLDVPEFIPRG